jgi:hypothetical protein
MNIKEYWVYFTHNGIPGRFQVRAYEDQQAIDEVIQISEQYYTDEEIKFVRLEVIKSEHV